jgi:hypothetical protein
MDAQRYADLIHGAQVTILPGEAGHFIRVQDEAERATILQQVSQMAVAFFEQAFAKK